MLYNGECVRVMLGFHAPDLPVVISYLNFHCVRAALLHVDDYYLKTMRLRYGGSLGDRASRGIGLTARLCRNSWRSHFSTCT